MKAEQYVGRRFGRLVILAARRNNGRTYFDAQCDCGRVTSPLADSVLRGSTKSCGCGMTEKTGDTFRTHGLTEHPLYSIWCAMKSRCYSKNNSHFPYYGGVGITVCEEWVGDFHAFYEWSVSHGYAPGLTIDRKDVYGNYSPKNCRWATHTVQARNKRNTRRFTHNGVTKPIADWADETHVPYKKVMTRIYTGWPIEKALELKQEGTT